MTEGDDARVARLWDRISGLPSDKAKAALAALSPDEREAVEEYATSKLREAQMIVWLLEEVGVENMPPIDPADPLYAVEMQMSHHVIDAIKVVTEKLNRPVGWGEGSDAEVEALGDDPQFPRAMETVIGQIQAHRRAPADGDR